MSETVEKEQLQAKTKEWKMIQNQVQALAKKAQDARTQKDSKNL